jgi:hypothetical protein
VIDGSVLLLTAPRLFPRSALMLDGVLGMMFGAVALGELMIASGRERQK